jgi:hypothetical protein
MKDVMEAVARQLATEKLPEDKLERIAKSVSVLAEKDIHARLDICKYGICLDMLVPGTIRELDPRLFSEFAFGDIAGVEVFPWGIINPDMVQVRIGQRF